MLRGLASTMVFGFHLFNLSNGYLGTDLLWRLTYYGKFGVQFFFVISGFVITYSMLNAQYKLKDFPRFLMKRIIRIEPPYLIVLALTVVFLWIRVKTGLGRGELYIPTWDQVLLAPGLPDSIFELQLAEHCILDPGHRVSVLSFVLSIIHSLCVKQAIQVACNSCHDHPVFFESF